MSAATNHRASIATVLAIGVAMLGLVLATGIRASGASTLAVTIKGYAFDPPSLHVAVGDTVTWTNQDDAPHTVTSSSGPDKLDSPQLAKGESWSFTFTKAGTYAYYCAIHPDMKAEVVVDPDGGSASGAGGGAGSSSGSGGGSSGGGGSSSPPSDGSGGGSSEGSGSSSGGGDSMGGNPPSGSSSCAGLTSAMTEPFVVHFDKAHLERSPSGQVSDLLDPDQYVKTHTVLIEDMTSPAVAALEAAPTGLAPFVMHFDTAHLERSPAGQASDLLDADQYVKTHTVLVEAMTAPTVGAVAGGSC